MESQWTTKQCDRPPPTSLKRKYYEPARIALQKRLLPCHIQLSRYTQSNKNRQHEIL